MVTRLIARAIIVYIIIPALLIHVGKEMGPTEREAMNEILKDLSSDELCKMGLRGSIAARIMCLFKT